MKILLEYIFEFIFGIVLLIIAIILPFLEVRIEVSWLIGFSSIVIPISIAILKSHITSQMSSIVKLKIEKDGLILKTMSIFNDLKGLKYDFARKRMMQAHKTIIQIRDGRIPITPVEYFIRLNDAIESAPSGSEIFAVNCIDDLMWINDEREKKYLLKNLEAARRNVKIKRIFIVNKTTYEDESKSAQKSVIQEQIDEPNMDISIVWRENLSGLGDKIIDWVLFTHLNQEELYEGYADRTGGSQIGEAYLVLDEKTIERRKEDFKILSGFETSL